VADSGAVECLDAVGASPDIHRTNSFDRTCKVGISGPDDNHPVPLQGAELLRRTERDCTAANDDHHRIVQLCH
jgi:hypothetical protein